MNAIIVHNIYRYNTEITEYTNIGYNSIVSFVGGWRGGGGSQGTPGEDRWVSFQ